MYFIIHNTDKPGHQQVRTDNRPAHLEFMKANKDRIVTAGPTIDDADGETMTGSLLIVDFADRAAAEVFAGEDPYARAGLFESVIIRRWKMVFAPQ